MTREELKELISEAVKDQFDNAAIEEPLNEDTEILSEAAIAENEFNEAYAVLETCLLEEYILAEEVDMIFDEQSRSNVRNYERGQGRRKGESKQAFRKRMEAKAKETGNVSFKTREAEQLAVRKYEDKFDRMLDARKKFGKDSEEYKEASSQMKQAMKKLDTASNKFNSEVIMKKNEKKQNAPSIDKKEKTEKMLSEIEQKRQTVESINKKDVAESISNKISDTATPEDAKSTALTVVAKDMGSKFKVKDGKIISVFKNPDGSLNKKAIAIAALATATAASIGAAAVALKKKKKAKEAKEKDEK